MSWIALTDRRRSLFCADGLARSGQGRTVEDENLQYPMPSGSLVLETQVSPYDRPQLLIGFDSERRGATGLTLQALPGGGLVLVMTRGGEIFHAAVNLDSGGRTDTLRITYCWDLRARRGRLTVEQPGRRRIATRSMPDPMPLSPADIRDLTTREETRILAPDVTFIAASNRIEPVGPMPSLTVSTPVMTSAGYRPVGNLRRGDVVQTLDGSLVPVLANLRRTVPAAGLFAPIRLRTPYFGLTRSITTAPSQHLVIGGSRVEYMFGAEHVLVPTGHLLHGSAAQSKAGDTLITYCQVLLPDHEAVLCAGTFVETLNIGRVRRRPEELRQSLLCDIPRAMLPEHSRTAFPVLGEFEALTLAATRAAA
jgi:hypothetical protein